MPLAHTAPNSSTTPAAADVAHGRQVLQQAAAALQHLAACLDDSFSHALDIIQTAQHNHGRVIVTGVGKSGHVGAKLAATFASTGTLSTFIHATEASHGDLGMIQDQDCILAISRSGETKELADIIAYAQRYGIPLIALTGKPHSTLAHAATVTLQDHVSTEACPNNLAPTTSSSAALALGDALAVALMHRNGFAAQDFARFHPGGKLGAQLLTVADLMITGADLPMCAPTTAMSDVLLELTGKNRGCVGVVQHEKLVGIITDGDLKRHMSPDLLGKTAADLLTPTPITIRPEQFANQAVKLMQTRGVTVLLVTNSQQAYLGLVQLQHCLQAGVV